jgi:hypothetical protein
MSEENESEEGTPDFQAEVESFVEGVAGLFDSLKDIFVKSKEEVVRGAALGKVRIDVYQLRKDREHFMQRLGEEAYDLLVAGDIAHDGLARVFEKIQGVDQQIVEYEEEIARIAEEQAAAAAAAAASDEAANDSGDAPATAEADAPASEEAPEDEPPDEPDDKPAKKKGKGKKKG